jgi:Protein of unknown function (DUF4232)
MASGVPCGSAVFVLAVVGCGGTSSHESKPAPPLGTSASAGVASPPVAPTASTAASVAAPPVAAESDGGASGAVKDPDASEGSMCGGTDVDLTAVLANKRCRPGRDAAPTPASATKTLKVTLVASAATVTPGGHVDLALEIVNTSAAAIPLYFSGDLALTPEVKDAKGTRIAPPSGNAPKSSDPKCREADCRLPASHIVLAPGGKAHAHVGWDAVKRAWPKEPPPGCCIVHVDAAAAGPLAAGTYKVKVPLPYETAQGNPADPEVEMRVAK